jgi:hypothetical protein
MICAERKPRLARRRADPREIVLRAEVGTTRRLPREPGYTGLADTFRRTVVRSRDLLVVELHFHDLALDATGSRLAPTPGGEPLIVAHLPPQHLAEQVFEHDPQTDIAPVAPSYSAELSRVAFRLPSTVTSVPLQLDALLDLLRTCDLRVVDAALPRSEDPSPPGCLVGFIPWIANLFGPPGPALRPPRPDETSLEVPWRLILSPPSSAGFIHLPRPFESAAGRSELWHSQLGIVPGTLGELDAADRSVRAVWLRTGDEGNPFNPNAPTPIDTAVGTNGFVTTLAPGERQQIVHLSANFRARRLPKPVQIYPRAISVKRMALTSQGATVNLAGEWTPPAELSLAEWVHRSSVGRDTYVRTEHVGWLFPFGHRARFIKISERHFDDRPSRAALIRQICFVMPLERVRTYAVADAPEPRLARQMPLRRVEVLTRITTPIECPTTADAFEIQLPSGAPFLFDLHATDAVSGGNPADVRMPLWFVFQGQDPQKAIDGFSKDPWPLDGDGKQAAGGVPFDIVGDPSPPPGDSTWRVRSVTWSAAKTAPGSGTTPPPPFYPIATRISLRIPAAEAISGGNADGSVAFHTRYLDHGLDPGQNPGALVADMSAAAIPLAFDGKADRTGGLVRPDLSLTGLSRTVGPVGGPDLDAIANGNFNPSDFFKGAKAPKLFGAIPLDGVLTAMGLHDGGKPRAPRIQVEPDGSATLRWEPQLQDYPTTKPVFVTTGASRFTLTVRTPAAPTAAVAAHLECNLESFGIHLVPGFEAIEIDFDHARFTVDAGKPDVDVVLRDNGVRFVGPLSFVETLQRIIPLDGFSDPPSVHVDAHGAEAGFSLGVPSLTLGIFSLENISFGAGFLIPFDERSMSVNFNFCTRSEPFLLTVSALGGGGFFLIEVDAAGVKRLEAALEFGASLSLDFGVASGGVHVMAGVYFAYDSTKGAALTGYFRVGGNVTALGIVSVSIELYLGLAYEFSSGKAVGKATLTIEVEVFLFSASVEISCERKFAGSKGDPTLLQVMAPYDKDSDVGVSASPVGYEIQDGEWPFETYWNAYG